MIGRTAETNAAALEMNRRVLVIDDNQAIHDDFKKILCGDGGDAELNADEADLFGGNARSIEVADFQIDSAFQGEEGLAFVRKSLEEGRPYTLAFVDVHMPPGWDGIETVSRIWKECPELEVVICTAYADYSWDEMTNKLGLTDQFLILMKPFDNIEVRQLAYALTSKWNLARQVGREMDDLKRIVESQSRELAEQKRSREETIERV